MQADEGPIGGAKKHTLRPKGVLKFHAKNGWFLSLRKKGIHNSERLRRGPLESP